MNKRDKNGKDRVGGIIMHGLPFLGKTAFEEWWEILIT